MSISISNLFYPQMVNEEKKIYIEVSTICNARCVFCPYKLNLRKKKIMSLIDYERIAKSCISLGIKNLSLTSMSGEFFTHPDSVEILKTSRDIGFTYIELYTNAIDIRNYDISAILENTDFIYVSFPGFSKGIYKEIYGVDRYDDFIESILILLKKHKELNSKTIIQFDPRTYLSLEEIKESDFYKNFLFEYLSDVIYVNYPLVYFDTWSGLIKKTDLLYGMKLSPTPLKSIWPIKKNNPCGRMELYISILVNGDVRFCGCRYDNLTDTPLDSLYIANIYDYCTLSELLLENKKKIRDIKYGFINGKMPELCKDCTMYYPAEKNIDTDCFY